MDYSLQAPPSMELTRQEYCSEFLFPSPGDLSDSGIKPVSPALQGGSLPPEAPGKPSLPALYVGNFIFCLSLYWPNCSDTASVPDDMVQEARGLNLVKRSCPRPSVSSDCWPATFQQRAVGGVPDVPAQVIELTEWKRTGDIGSGNSAENLPPILENSDRVTCSVMSNSFATPWTVAYQAPLSMGFSRKKHWSGLPFPPPGGLPTQVSTLCLPHCRQIPRCLSHQEIPR